MPSSTGQWLDRFFASYYRHRPVSATFIGVHDDDGALPDYSASGIASQRADIRSLLDEVDSGAVQRPSTTWEAIDRMLARNFLLTQLWELEDTRVLLANPCLYTGEGVFGIVSLFLRDFSPLDDRVDAATRRLLAIPDLLAQGRVNVTRCPTAWVERAIDECDGAVKLLTDGVAVLAARHGVTGTDFHAAAGAAVAAFREFRQYLVEEVAPVSHDSYGVGSQQFDMLLRLGHCLDIDGEAVIQYATKRLADARTALQEHTRRIEPAADPASLLSRLGDIHPSIDGYYDAYQVEWDHARAFAIERDLLRWPDYPISFEPIPDWARSAAPHLYFLFYRAPAPFDTHVDQRYLVTPIEPDMPAEEQRHRLKATNLSQIRLNHVIHHAGIGHHIQNWWAYRGESRIGQIAAVDCSMRIAMLCGGTMAEGWSCYATGLMAEQGFLTPLEELSEHQSLARMAGRAIVDARLHRGEFSLDDALAFYRDDIGMPEAAARSEAVKNSMFPGAAMMYLLGTDMIHDLREELRARRGSEFSLGRFHDEFLSHGSIPVALIAKLMKGEQIEIEGYVDPQPGH
jgi:uncharacterized protein (DUF885 family)